jgi:hypothetical protein
MKYHIISYHIISSYTTANGRRCRGVLVREQRRGKMRGTLQEVEGGVG